MSAVDRMINRVRKDDELRMARVNHSGPSIIARHSSVCRVCERPVDPGEVITCHVGRWVHTSCLDSLDPIWWEP